MFHSFLARTDPRDVARVESKTYICTEEKRESIPTAKDGVEGRLGKWMSVKDMNKELSKRFPGCMKGKDVSSRRIQHDCHPHAKTRIYLNRSSSTKENHSLLKTCHLASRESFPTLFLEDFVKNCPVMPGSDDIVNRAL